MTAGEFTHPPTISVVIATYRRPEVLARTIRAFLDCDDPAVRLELIVVDDDDDPAIDDAVPAAEAGPSVRLVHQANRGAAGARNRGAATASGELLVFCDDDVVVPADHLRRHVAAQEGSERRLCAAFSVLDPEVAGHFRSTPFGRWWLDLEDSWWAPFDDGSDGGLVPLPMLSARNFSVRRETFELIGGFDETFPYAGAEDQDFSIRAREQGCELLIDRDNRVVHIETRLDFEAFCRREERGGATYAVLARKHPDGEGDTAVARLNSAAPGDASPASAGRRIRAMLSGDRGIDSAHRLVATAERLRLPDPLLRPLYRRVVGMHIARGYRAEEARR
jgi:GT2 family glycosyltransferase